MTTKHLSGYYGSGYTLAAGYGKLVIDKTAYVFGGVVTPDFATVVNHGAVYGGDGVVLKAGGSVINGSAMNTGASITGYFTGVEALGFTGVEALGAATVANFGTIGGLEEYFGVGVILDAGGSVSNGSAEDTNATIFGYDGVTSTAAATVANFGTISAGDGYGHGVRLEAGGLLTNGSAHDATALISALYAVQTFGAAATVINFGTIGETVRDSVYLGAGGEVVAEAGSTFLGLIDGGDGTLALAGGGTGTLSSLGAGGTLTGAVEAEFAHFDQVVIEAGGAWTLAGSNAVDRSATLVDEGTLINSGALTIAGTLSIEAAGVFRLASGDILTKPTGDAGIVDYGLMIKSPGQGTITVGAHMFDRGAVEVASGALDFTSRLYGTGVMKIDAGATLEADDGAVSTLTITFDGAAAALAVASPKGFTATLSGFAAGDTIDLLAVKATGASVNDSDQLVVVNGTKTVASLQLSGNYAGATFTTGSDGHGGTDVMLASGGGAGRPSVAGMASAMAALGAPAAVAALGYDLRAERTPVLARPNVHLQ